jgi:putative transposase
MPRSRRVIPPGSVLHVVNRGNDRRALFHSDAEFGAFRDLMRRAATRTPLRILAYALMPNHWHLVVWPETGTQLSRYLQGLCTSHAARWRRETGTVGEGHVYQDRFHAFVIESERQYFNVLRYVEANPVRAGLVMSAAEWRWSSLCDRESGAEDLITAGPLALPPGWATIVDQSLPAPILDELRARHRTAFRPAWRVRGRRQPPPVPGR